MSGANSSYTFDMGLPEKFEFIDTGAASTSKTIYGGKSLDPNEVTITEAGFGKLVTFVSEQVPDESTTYISVFIPPLSFGNGRGGIYALSEAIISKRAINFAGGNPPIGQVVRFENARLIGHASMTSAT